MRSNHVPWGVVGELGGDNCDDDHLVIDPHKSSPKTEGHEIVGIIGGGIGGLSLGVSLRQAHIPCIIYERDSQFNDRMQGYGLTLTYNPKGPLESLGVLETCVKLDCPSNRHWIFNKEGHIRGYFGRGIANPQTPPCEDFVRGAVGATQRGNLRVPRQVLRQNLLERFLQIGGTIKWGKRIRDYEEVFKQGSKTRVTQGVRLSFEDDTEEFVSVLVGADGLRSKVRQLRDEKMVEKLFKNPKSSSTAAHHIGAKSVSHAESATNSMTSVPIPSLPFTNPHRCASILRPNYLGVSVIIGLSTYRHPLISEGGFYVYAPGHRLFIMPFSVSNHNAVRAASAEGKTSDSAAIKSTASSADLKTVTMWQLSYSTTESCGINPSNSVDDFSQENLANRLWGIRNSDAEEDAMRYLFPKHSKKDISMKNKFSNCEARERLKELAKSKMGDWFPCCANLVENTPLSDIWATPLYDRSPDCFFNPLADYKRFSGGSLRTNPDSTEIIQASTELTQAETTPTETSETSPDTKRIRLASSESEKVGMPKATNPGLLKPQNSDAKQARNPHESVAPKKSLIATESLVTLIGDAAHPMSMFKGQGANQAIADGPLLTSHLTKLLPHSFSVGKRLRHFEREMIQRAGHKVLASRRAALQLHSIRNDESLNDTIGWTLAGLPVEYAAKDDLEERRSQKDQIESIKVALQKLRDANITARSCDEVDFTSFRTGGELGSILEAKVSNELFKS